MDPQRLCTLQGTLNTSYEQRLELQLIADAADEEPSTSAGWSMRVYVVSKKNSAAHTAPIAFSAVKESQASLPVRVRKFEFDDL